MKTSIVDVAVRGQSVCSALKSGTYTVAGTGLCGVGSVLSTAANVGQKVVDMTRAAGKGCTAKGEEFLAEAAVIKGEEPAKKEEGKVEAQEQQAEPQQQQAQAPKQQKSSKTWSLADFVAQHNEFAAAASAVIKEYTKVVFRAEGSMKGVVTAFDATRRSDGAHCSVFADMANKTFSVVAPPVKKEEKSAKKAVKKAAAPRQEKASKKAAPAKKAAVKAEPAKTEEAAEENSMKAALEAARAKKTAAKTKAETKKEEKSSEKADGKKEPYSSNPKADMALEEAAHDHGEWLDKIIRHFQAASTKPLANVAVKSNCLKFSSYGENGQDDAVSVAFKSHKVKVNRKEVELDL